MMMRSAFQVVVFFTHTHNHKLNRDSHTHTHSDSDEDMPEVLVALRHRTQALPGMQLQNSEEEAKECVLVAFRSQGDAQEQTSPVVAA
jgi:hypothetical protein